MFHFERRWFLRDEWLQHGRVIVVSNDEARDVCNHWENNKRGAWHTFGFDQTRPVEQMQQVVAA